MSFYNPTVTGPSKKRRRLSDDFDMPRNNGSSPREGSTSNYYHRERTPPKASRDDRDGLREFRFGGRDTRSPPPQGSIPRGYSHENDEEHSDRYSSPPGPVQKNRGSSAYTSYKGSPQPKKDSTARRQSTPVAMPPAIIEQVNHEKITKELALLFARAFEDFTTSAALKIREDVAQKAFEKRDEEYKKARSTHEKFPQVEETQKKDRDRAEKKLKSIKEKSQIQDALLKDIAFQSASTLVPAVLFASAQDIAQSRRNDELEKTCKQLQTKIQDIRTYIKEQKNMLIEDEKKRQHASSVSEGDIKTLKDDLKDMRNITSSLSYDLKQKLDKLSDLPGHLETVNNLELEVSRAREDASKNTLAMDACLQQVSGLEATLEGIKMSMESSPNLVKLQNQVVALEGEIHDIRSTSLSKAATSSDDSSTLQSFRSRVQFLEDKVKDLPALDERIVISSSFDEISKDIQILHKAESTRKENEIALSERLSSIEKQQGIIEDKQLKVTEYLSNSPLPALAARVDVIERDLKASFSPLAAKVDIIEKNLNIAINSSTALQEQVSALERESNEKIVGLNKSTLTIENEFSSLKALSIKNKLTAVENRIDVLEKLPHSNTSPSTTVSASADFDTEDIIRIVKQDMVKVNADSENFVLEQIGGLLDETNKSLENIKTRCTSLETSLSNLKTDFTALKGLPAVSIHEQSQQSLQQFQADLLTERENAKNSIVKVAVNQTISAIQQQPDLLPYLTEENVNGKLGNVKNMLGDMNTRLSDRIDGNVLSILSIDSRLANINTKDMVEHMINQMEGMYPYARNCQDLLSKHDGLLNTTKTQIDDLVLSLDALNNRADNLDSRPHASSDDTTALQAKVDGLDSILSEIRSIAVAARDGVVGNCNEYQQYKNDTETRFSLVGVDIDDLKKVLKDLTVREFRQLPIPTYPPPPASLLARKARGPTSTVTSPLGRSFSSNDTGAARKTASVTPTPRPTQRSASNQSDAGHKKRKLNGSISSIESKTNGVNGALKRRKKKPVDGDDTSDEDFEPTQPRIIVSDDED